MCVICISNDNYKSTADLHKSAGVCSGDEVTLRTRHERFPPGTWKKFHARRLSSYRVLWRISFNAYELDMPRELRINHAFNVEYLATYCALINYLIVILDPSSSIAEGPNFLVHLPPLPQ